MLDAALPHCKVEIMSIAKCGLCRQQSADNVECKVLGRFARCLTLSALHENSVNKLQLLLRFPVDPAGLYLSAR